MNSSHNGSGLDRAKIVQMIVASLEEVLVTAAPSTSAPLSEDTRLIGREAVLDSMGLVNLIIEVEQRLEEEYDIAVVLADERAMSQKNSPFRSIQTLADYICQVAAE
jgi:acyl carrier protein